MSNGPPPHKPKTKSEDSYDLAGRYRVSITAPDGSMILEDAQWKESQLRPNGKGVTHRVCTTSGYIVAISMDSDAGFMLIDRLRAMLNGMDV